MAYNLDVILKKSKVIKFWEYRSLIDTIIYKIEYNKVGLKDDYIGEPEKDEYKLRILKEFEKLCKKAKVFSTNKIVLQIKTKEGEVINVGWYDGKLNFGFGRQGDKYIKEKIL